MRKGLRALVLLVALLIAAVLWLVGTPGGLATLLAAAERASGGALQVEQPRGRLLGGMTARQMVLRFDGGELSTQDLHLEWTPWRLLLGEPLAITLRVRRATIAGRASGSDAPQAPPAPVRLPQSLSPLPMTLSLRIGELAVDAGTGSRTITDLHLDAQADARQLVIRRLALRDAEFGQARLSARVESEATILRLASLRLDAPVTLEAELAIARDDGAMDGHLRWRDLRWPTGEDPLLISAEGSLRLSGTLRAPQAQLAARLGEATRLEGHAALRDKDIAARLDWQDLRWPLAGDEPLLVSPTGSLQLAGPPDAMALELQAALAGKARIAADGRVGPGGADLSLQVRALRWPVQGPPRLKLDRATGRLHGPWSALQLALAGELASGGQVRLDAALHGRTATVQLEGRDLDLHHASGLPLRLATVDLAADGTASRWQARLAARGTLADGPLAARLRAEGDADAARLSELSIALLGGRVEGSAEVDWGEARQATARLKLAGIDPGRLAPQWPGSLNGQAKLRLGFSASPELLAQWQLADARLRGRPLAGRGRLRLHQQRWSVEGVELTSGDSRVTIDGRLLPDADFAAGLASDNLADFAPQLAGTAQAQLSVRGDWRLPQLVGSGRVAGLRVGPWSVDSAQWQLTVDAAGQAQGSAEAAGIDVGYRFDSARLRVDGSAADHQLTALASGEDGSARLGLKGAWDPQALRWTGVLHQAALEPVQLAAWHLEEPAALRLSVEAAELEPACLSGDDGRVCAQLDYRHGALFAAARLDALRLAALAPLLPPDWQVEGVASGRGHVRIAGDGLERAEVALDVARGELRAGRAHRLAFSDLALRAREGAGEGLLSLHLRLPGGRAELELAASGPVMAERALDGRLEVDWPEISALGLLSPEIAEASGALRGRFAIGGQLRRPRLDGGLRVEDGGLLLRTPNLRLEQLSADITATPDGGVELRARARAGEGELSADGRLADGTLRVQLHGRQVLAVNTPEAQVVVDPDLELRLSGGRVDLAGTVTVPWARITPRRIPEGGISPSPDAVRLGQAQDAGLLALHSRLELLLGEDVRFSGMGLDARLSGRLRLVDAPGTPTTARGELQLVDGRYEAWGQELSISTGRLIYAGTPVTDPVIELLAERRPREDITVGVRVRGPLRAPELRLYSQPAMPEEQALGWLVLGRDIQSGTTDAERAALGDAALLLGLKGGQWLAERLSGRLALDEIAIGARPGESADQARLTLGKYLSPRLFVRYGVSLFQPGQLLELRYTLRPGLTLETRTGTESGADLIYTFERGRPEPPAQDR